MLSAGAADFEVPPAEPAAASLPPALSAGTDFHVREPVESDGLMRHYIIDSKFGEFTAYGPRRLKCASAKWRRFHRLPRPRTSMS